jgi:sodium/bile acid cotransporter 7
MIVPPIAVGQLLRKTRVKDVYTKHSKKFKRAQELILLGIVWNAFCNAFTKGLGLQFSHGLTLLLLLPTLHLGSLAILFQLFRRTGISRGNVVAAMFCASHKTLAFGLPLVNTIFEGNANLAAYCAPIMFIHPLQLVLGSLLIPRLEEYTAGEDESSSRKSN